MSFNSSPNWSTTDKYLLRKQLNKIDFFDGQPICEEPKIFWDFDWVVQPPPID
jgi:hypothetical protein